MTDLTEKKSNGPSKWVAMGLTATGVSLFFAFNAALEATLDKKPEASLSTEQAQMLQQLSKERADDIKQQMKKFLHCASAQKNADITSCIPQ